MTSEKVIFERSRGRTDCGPGGPPWYDHARLNFFLASTTAALAGYVTICRHMSTLSMVQLHPMDAPLLKRDWNFRTVRNLKMQALACGGPFE